MGVALRTPGDRERADWAAPAERVVGRHFYPHQGRNGAGQEPGGQHRTHVA